MNTQLNAMKKALEALESGDGWRQSEAITALRTAIEQAEKQEPPVVAELLCVCGCEWEWRNRDWELVSTPPAAQRQWVGLTDESVVSAAARVLSDRVAASCNVDCGDMWMLHGNDSIEDARAMLEAAEAKLKEKNT